MINDNLTGHPQFRGLFEASWYTRGSQFRPGMELADVKNLVEPANEADDESKRYWSDGNSRSAGREFSGLSRSACYLNGEISCLSCHSMHESDPNDQLTAGMNSNDACYQCHANYRDAIEEHTHHPVGSSGSQCYNCHMAHTSYGLLKAIRNHQIDRPYVATIGSHGRPNACNLCHLDKTLSWTAEHLSEWYGADKPELTEDEKNIAASALWLLTGDAGQRAVVAWNTGWQPAMQASQTDWLAPVMAQLLEDPYSAVRFIAHRALQRYPGFEQFQYDFDGAEENRAEAKQRVLKIWSNTSNKSDRIARPEVLLNAQGEMQFDEINRLLQQRNDHRMGVIE